MLQLNITQREARTIAFLLLIGSVLLLVTTLLHTKPPQNLPVSHAHTGTQHHIP